MTAPIAITLTVNGLPRSALAEPRTTLLDLLRDHLGLTGTHAGCEHGVCGACSVLLEDEPVRACCLFAPQVEGMRVTTVEGLAPARDQLSALQDAFLETHALQCGYCTPGMLIACTDLLARIPRPTEAEIRDAIGGNICRCTGYQQIVDAVKLASGQATAHG